MSNQGLRWNEGKAPLHMIPLHLLEGAAHVFHDVTTREERPYPAWNWLKEQNWSVPYACMMRHMSKWQMGEDYDDETGRSHLDHAMCNLLMLIHYAKQYPHKDDRPRSDQIETGVIIELPVDSDIKEYNRGWL